VRGHGHDRAGAVAHEHEVRDPDRHLLAGDRMDRAEAGVDAFLLGGFDVGFRGAAVAAFLDERSDERLALRGLLRERMLGGDGEIGHAHERVRARREHGQRFAFAFDGELDFEAFGAADPVALHRLDGIRPARQRVEAVEQFLGVVGDLEEPLRNFALLDERAGAPAAAVDDLLVGEHGLVDRVPIHDRVLAIGEPFLEQAHEHALLVDVVVGATGREFARPVDRIAELRELAAHVLDVRVGPFRRRGVVLDRRVLGGQAECVPAHRLQDVLAVHALEAADDVADRVVAHVAHVQRAGRIRQHRQAVELRLGRVFLDLERVRRAPVGLRGGLDGLRVVGLRFVVFLDRHGLGAASCHAGKRRNREPNAAQQSRKARAATRLAPLVASASRAPSALLASGFHPRGASR
jgi:hypothetical protein